MSFKMYYSAEAPLAAIEKQLIAVVGYGSQGDRKSTRLNSSHMSESRMPSSA